MIGALRALLDGRGRTSEHRLAACVAALVFVLWIPALFGGFAWDDANNLVDGSRLKNGRAFFEVFVHDAMWSANMQQAVIGTYRPLSLASFVVDYFFLSLIPWNTTGSAAIYHLSSNLLHAAAAYCVCLALLRWVPRRVAVALTLLFAVHPVGSEAVAWVNGRSEVFALIFGALAIRLVSYANVSWTRAALAGLMLFWSLMGKETGLTFLPMAVLFAGEASRSAGPLSPMRRFLPALSTRVLITATVALAGYLGMRAMALSGNGPLPGLEAPEGLMRSAAALLLRAFQGVLVPTNLSVTYLYLWVKSLDTVDVTVAAFVFGALVMVVAVTWVQGRRLATLGFVWWLISVLPITLLAVRDWPGMQRWLYMGLPGFALFIYGLLCGRLPPRVLRLGAAVWFIALFVPCQIGIQIWRTSGTLFRQMTIDQPDEPFGWVSLSSALLREGDYVAAEEAAREGGLHKPRGHNPWPFLAYALAMQERCDEAVPEVDVEHPNEVMGSWVHYSLGYCFENKKQPESAIARYLKCVTEASCKTRHEYLTGSLATAQSATPSAAPREAPGEAPSEAP